VIGQVRDSELPYASTIYIYISLILFFLIAEGGAKICGVFRVKNHDFTQKNHIFSARAGCAPSGSAPGVLLANCFPVKLIFILFLYLYNKHRLFVSQLYIKETDKEQLTHD
jgi:hypothetical protein